MTTRKSLRARAMLLETAAAAVAALVLLTKTKTLMAAVSAASPTPSIGLPGCVTSCGDVAVPFPFGIGPAANCSLPGFNLTCDDDRGGKGPPRLLLGDLQVKDIDLDYCLMTVLHSGDTRISGSGGTLFGGSLPEDGPYRLASQNELTVLSCNTAATLRSGNIIMSGCFTFCEAGYGSLDHPFSTGCNGMGCCRAPIVTNHRDLEAAEGKLEVHITWLGPGPGLNRSSSTDLLHVLVAEEGWFDQHFGSDVIVLEPPDVARVPVPLLLEWEVVGAVPDTNDSNTTRDCIGGPRGGYRCICNHGYQGNPYIPHGCKDIDECEHPPERTALNLRSPAPWGPDTGKVQETKRLALFTAMEALYQGPRAMGLPIASAICWFWVAFSIAWISSRSAPSYKFQTHRPRATWSTTHGDIMVYLANPIRLSRIGRRRAR